MTSLVFETIVSIGIVAILGAFVYVGRKLQKLEDLEKKVGHIQDNVQVISLHLTRHHIEFDPSELRSLSPYQLTKEGNAFINDVGFDDIIAAHQDKFFAYIESEMPSVKYDVETAAIQSVIFLQNEPFMKPLRIYMYNNPDRNLENMAATLGIYIRDKFLEVHPEITE